MGASEHGPRWLVGAAGLVDGRAAATFVVLAGVGISLLSRNARVTGDVQRLQKDRTALLKRALFLFAVGLLYTPIWPADILHFYGVYIAIAALLLGCPTRGLWTLAGVLPFVFVMLSLVLDYEQGWNWETLHYTGLWTPAGMARHLLFNGFHPVVPWLGFLLVGMAIGRLDMTDAAVRKRVFLFGIGAAVFAEVTSFVLVGALSTVVSPADQEAIVAIFGTEPMPPMPLYMLAGTGTACAVIAAAVAIGERFASALWLKPFVATGQIALTLYVAHVVIGMGVIEEVDRLENQSLPFALGSAAIFCVLAMVFAHFWQSRYERGPLEAVMRWLTDQRAGKNAGSK